MAFPEKTKRNEEIIAKRQDGWTYGKIAKHFNVGKFVPWRVVQRYEKTMGKLVIHNKQKK